MLIILGKTNKVGVLKLLSIAPFDVISYLRITSTNVIKMLAYLELIYIKTTAWTYSELCRTFERELCGKVFNGYAFLPYTNQFEPSIIDMQEQILKNVIKKTQSHAKLEIEKT